MNQGGRPKGPSKTTILKQRSALEQADPSLRDQRLEEEKAKKRALIGMFCAAPAKRTCPVRNEGEASKPLQDHDKTAHEKTTCEGSNTPHPPPLPQLMSDREEGAIYRHTYQGIERRVKWSGRYLHCVCPMGGICGGGKRLERCKTSDSRTTSGDACQPLEKRAKPNLDYASVNSGRSLSMKDRPSRDLTTSELEFMTSMHFIPRSSKESAVVVMEIGRWHKEFLEHEAWSFTSNGVTFPLRVGAKWRKTFRGRHASVIGASQVTILFEIALSSKPDQPSFRARALDQGPFASQFHAVDVHDLERKWLSQTNDISNGAELLSTQRIRGAEFVGFQNVNVAYFFIDVTADFAQHYGERALKGGDIGDRQKRRRVNNMLAALDGALARGHQDPDKAFKMMIESRAFKTQFGDLLESHFGEVTAKGLVEIYQACIKRGQHQQARLVLSTYASTHTRAQTMQRFECSERQVKAANLSFRLRNVPADTRKVVKYSTYPRDTVNHFEGWALNPKTVMRAAGGKAAFLLRANRNRLFLMYKDECQMDGISGMCRSNFYKFYAESIFREMTRVIVCARALVVCCVSYCTARVCCEMLPVK